MGALHQAVIGGLGAAPGTHPGEAFLTANATAWIRPYLEDQLYQELYNGTQTTAAGDGDPCGYIVNHGTGEHLIGVGDNAFRMLVDVIDGRKCLINNVANTGMFFVHELTITTADTNNSTLVFSCGAWPGVIDTASVMLQGGASATAAGGEWLYIPSEGSTNTLLKSGNLTFPGTNGSPIKVNGADASFANRGELWSALQNTRQVVVVKFATTSDTAVKSVFWGYKPATTVKIPPLYEWAIFKNQDLTGTDLTNVTAYMAENAGVTL